MTSRRIVITSIMCAAAVAALIGAGNAIAARAGSRTGQPAILAPRDASLVTGSTMLVRARAKTGFTALVGDHDVAARFRLARGGIRTARLRVGADIKLGFNRLVVSAGVGKARRYTAVTFTVARRAPGALHVVGRLTHSSAIRLMISEAHGARFSQVRITLNGRTMRSDDWVVGSPTPWTEWPFPHHSFDASFGADDGARYGVNQLTVTAWSESGTYDRATLRARIGSGWALASAGAGRRTWTHRLVVLDGRATRTWSRVPVRYRWAIVSAPARSRARLTRADTARPGLRPDLPGRYVIRLQAWRLPRRGTQRARFPSSAASEDYTTIEATPPTPPVGIPIRTITSNGGIQVGSHIYTVPSTAWAQLLVLDRQTLQVISNQAIGSSGSPVTDSEANRLDDAIGGTDASKLVVISGGGRPMPGTTLEPALSLGLQIMVLNAGATAASSALPYEPTRWQSALSGGSWSIIGVPGVDNSATSNLYGLSYGLYAGNSSAPGGLTGFLQTDNNNNYTFVSAQYTSIDTQPPNTPQGEARVQIGSHVYSSDPSTIPSGGSGFYLLVLDSTLHELQSSTYYTNSGASANPSGVHALAEALFQANQTPGDLVVVQSINAPTGSTSDWSNDVALATDAFTTQSNAVITQDSSTWGSSSLVAALGRLAGAVAHDQVAHMVTPVYSAPDPSYGGQGYTLIASTGSLWDPTGAALSRSQAGSRSAQARVVGLLERSKQGLWSVHEPSSGTGPYNSVALAKLAYQPPTLWPLSRTPAERKVLEYLQSQLGFEYPIRTEYWKDSGVNWSSIASSLHGFTYPCCRYGFDAATFAAVKAQVYKEILDVELVQGLFQNWQDVFSSTESSGYADLQSIGQQVADSIQVRSQSSTAGNVLATTGESLWVASTVLSLFGQEEIAGPLGLAACLFDLTSDVVADEAGAADGAPDITGDVDQLGVAFADRYATIQSHLGYVENILVSDWGKLQQAAANTKDIWAFNQNVENDMVNSITNSAQRQFWTAILPVPYVEYAVDSPYVWAENQLSPPTWTAPWQVVCTSEGIFHSGTKPFGASMLDNRGSWETTPVRLVNVPPLTFNDQDWFGLTNIATLSQGVITDNPDTVPQSLTNPLFAPNDQNGLGMDKVAFFADPHWQRLWFYCSWSP
ncbi:MAG: hypothetical protein JO304_15330 [Solirubrobacterales bacterium]|nr:hypothetical protein [Solirubrobacterales bacterium]